MAYPTTINFQPITQVAGFQPINETSTTKAHALGTRVKAWDATYGEGEFLYLKGVASTAAGDLCTYDLKEGSTARAVSGGATSSGPCAVAMSANVANQFGWYQVGGAGPVKSATVSDNGQAYLTATAGQVDDLAVSGDLVSGMRFKTASATGASAWAADTAYAVNDLCTNDTGKVFKCVKAGISALAWQASTRYTPGVNVTNDSKLYVCIVGGVSNGSGGPTGTNTSGITDNGCTWGYVAAAGGPAGTGGGIQDNTVRWDYYASAANNQAFATAQMDSPSITSGAALAATAPLTGTGTASDPLVYVPNVSAPLSGTGTAGSPLVVAAASASVPGSMSAADKARTDAILNLVARLFVSTPAAATATDGVHADFAGNDASNNFPAPFTNPEAPRNLIVTMALNYDGGDVNVVGTDQFDVAVNETFTTGSNVTRTGAKIFKTVTSATKAAVGANAAAVRIGTGNKLGITENLTVTDGILWADGTIEAVTIDATYDAFTPTSTPNGAIVMKLLTNL